MQVNAQKLSELHQQRDGLLCDLDELKNRLSEGELKELVATDSHLQSLYKRLAEFTAQDKWR